MFQEEKVAKKIEHVVKDDIWGNIKDFLELGFHFGRRRKRDTHHHRLIALGDFFILFGQFYIKRHSHSFHSKNARNR